jgi:hypothetical protein
MGGAWEDDYVESLFEGRRIQNARFGNYRVPK